MPHIVFFSYARENLDRYLVDFFRDLCAEIAPQTIWAPDNDNISFRDKDNLRLMEDWKSEIEDALQSTAVLVCVTSVAYFNKEFCGKEYYLFDQRRRQGLQPGQETPPVILPVIWARISKLLPDYMNAAQQVPKGIPDSYREQGLRNLQRFEPNQYAKCVSAFADSIVDAWNKYPKIKPLTNVDFARLPNKFAGGDWQEAAGPGGWIPGPEVVNFVFAAPSKDDKPAPVGRYGTMPSEWRPYLPPEPTTILEHARNASKNQSFKFREIQVDQHLDSELKGAKDRKNLTVLLADPGVLPSEAFGQVQAIEKHWWDGTGAVLPSDDPLEKLREELNPKFPLLTSQMQTPHVPAPVRSANDLQKQLEETLIHLRTKVTITETGKKDKTAEAPPTVSASGGKP